MGKAEDSISCLTMQQPLSLMSYNKYDWLNLVDWHLRLII